jgi:D-arabinose 1-dehydrogenase-like Zn-dependent alcohol dehydrogenase
MTEPERPPSRPRARWSDPFKVPAIWLPPAILVAGVCVGVDQITPAMAINKELDLRFVLGYNPLEFHDTLRMLADGKVDPAPLITGTVGLAGVDAAFSALGHPDVHAKILIDPRSAVAAPAI